MKPAVSSLISGRQKLFSDQRISCKNQDLILQRLFDQTSGIGHKQPISLASKLTSGGLLDTHEQPLKQMHFVFSAIDTA
jgi:hypothetical protein